MALEILVNTGYGQENRLLDIIDDLSFTIDFSIADIQDISTSNGAYTKALQIPNTKNNRQIFGYVTDMSTDLGYNYYNNVKNSFNPNKKVECWVLEDSIEILHGYIQVTDFDINNISGNIMINVTIYADNASFYISMGDALISDMDFTEYNFTYSQAFIQSTWTSSYTPVYFPLIDNGNGWTLDEVNDPAEYQIEVKDFRPAVSVKTIWDKIFASQSFSVLSNFTRGNRQNGFTPDTRFSNLIIPYSQQLFQTGPLFNQDKIFHVGLTQTTLGQYSTYSLSTYENYILNHSNGELTNTWYTGFLMSPWQDEYVRNYNTFSSDWTTFQVEIPFGNTASPMFNTSVNGVDNYQYSAYDPTYYNAADTIFKQRFVLKTDMVTTYSNNGDFTGLGVPTPEYLKYMVAVNFYREIDPLTGTTSLDWSSGTGATIPPDLGFQNSGNTYSTATNSNYFWICDDQGKSNVFDVNGTSIVPTGEGRYLGKNCVSYDGTLAFAADNTYGGYTASDLSTGGVDYYYVNNSGNAPAWYYNDGYHSTTANLWVSGSMPFYNTFAKQTCYGDWYQNLQLQTIYLDGNPHDVFYGLTGTVFPNGNMPIQQGERVRCVVYFSSKFSGGIVSGSNYAPPVCGYLLSYTNFSGGVPYPYGVAQNPIQNNTPLTQWYNDVSSDYIAGMQVNFNDVVPQNIKMRDFVQDIVHLHNLYIDTSNDYPNTLIIEPRDNYYALSNQSLDWSNKLDISQPINVQVLAETQNKRTTFTYKADNDYYNKLYTQNTNEVYGQFINVIDNDFLTGETSIQSLFSPTPMTSLYSVFANNGGDSLASAGAFVLPVFVNGANVSPSSNAIASGSTQINYRLVYKNYIRNQNSDTILLFGQPTHYYPYAGPYDNPYNPQYTVNWGQTLGEFFDNPTDNVTANLVNTYWATLLTEMTDMDSRIITCYMFLTPRDIYQFYFYDLVFITINGVDGYYKVNSIEDYVPGKNTTCKVTLLRSNTFLTPNTFNGSRS